ncbi:MAG TPA: glutamate synthase-related protein [Spirochaetia bacterium]|nr:glutamate synthase-related protein [Spirochaetia bacterium]
MSSKYHISVKETAPRFDPAGKLNALEREGCLGCRICVKRTSCVYDVYRKRQFNAAQVVDTTDVLCINCMRCVQECKKNILERARNPQYDRMGDDYWRPDLIASLWKQAETGKIPVSGAGYRGPFVGPGFDSMWTDMSEIVRPTRDGIHGREYISTVIELGRRPAFLEFDAEGRLLSEEPRFVEIPIPMILQIPDGGFVTPSVRKAISQAAGRLGTIAGVPLEDAIGASSDQKGHLMARFDPTKDDPAALGGVPLAEIPYSDRVMEEAAAIRASNPAVVICIRVPLDEHAVARAVALASAGAEVLHLQADRNGRGLGRRRDDFLIQLVREVHLALLDHSQRDQLTLLVSGGMAMAEHVAKVLPCGADGVVLDTALLVAMECRLCADCSTRAACPVEIDRVSDGWGANRIVNLIGSWHSQLIEVMGAMGIREVRRLRGELGRVMFFSDLERENLAPMFGKRSRPDGQTTVDTFKGNLRSVKQDLGRPDWTRPGMGAEIKPCPSRFRNALGMYKVVRTAACTGCGTCADVCRYGVHVKAGKRILAPKAHLCQGSEVCRSEGRFCVSRCPKNAIRVGLDQTWQAFGDPRWPAELLAASWKQAETGYPPEAGLEYRVGESGGGFDRIALVFPDERPRDSFKPAEVDLRVALNRRKDGRPDVHIGVPFYGGGMSLGSISLVTMLARAAAYTAVDSFTCTGEGGYPEELQAYDDHVITQVATGLFGVREETIQRVRMVEFKYAQGAKPGLGGHLLGDKNTAAVARMREAVQGVSLFSPFPFHSVYSVEDHKKHVDWIKEVNTRALVSVKVSGASDVDMVAVGSYYAGAHVVHLDGSYGGTGAAPDIAKKNIAMPIEYAVPKVHRFLLAEGVRDQVTLVASGGVRTAWDIAKVVALGANAVVIGTAEMVALECIRCGACESGRGCARGIATTDPELSVLYSSEWAAQRLINLFHSWSIQLQQILWTLGLRSINDLVGRSDVLEHLDYERRQKPAELPGQAP